VVLSTPLKVFSIGLVIYVLQRLSDTLIDRLLKVFIEGKYLSLSASQRLTLRVSTVSRVSKSIISIILVGSGALAILSILGVDLVPLLAGAGIIGLAISFASQNILKDIINGFFILLEDHYAVGDVVAIGEVGGLVENMNLRITQLRNGEGRLITIPNSAITIVQNLSKEWSRADLTLEFSLDTDPDRILQILQQLADEIYQDRDWQPKILEQPEVLGIDAVKHNGLFVRIWIKTLPLEQWAVGREFRRRLKKVMDLEEIAIGMPQQSLSFSRSPLDEDNSLSTMKKLL
jgi:small conductance mechanosensitive channel